MVVKLKSLLANQMFAYASVKAIALDNQYDFKYIYERNKPAESEQSSVDKKYGKDLDTIFNIPKAEIAKRIDLENIKLYSEMLHKKGDQIYQKEATQQSNDTLMDGHFLSPKYFEHRLDEVREWFAFPNDILEVVNKEIDELHNKYKGKKIVAVHFRVGEDYHYNARKIDKSYWIDAANKMNEIYNNNCIFLLVYDKRTSEIKAFEKEFECEENHGSLLHDLCCISRCDDVIICNSTFSTMGALLNPNSPKVICPSVCITGVNKSTKGLFKDDWIIVDAKPDKISKICGVFRIGSFRFHLINLLHNLKILKPKKI